MLRDTFNCLSRTKPQIASTLAINHGVGALSMRVVIHIFKVILIEIFKVILIERKRIRSFSLTLHRVSS
jgi:hypothetical protein